MMLHAVMASGTGAARDRGWPSSASDSARTGSDSRRKVTGSTKATVQDKLKKLHEELDAGVRSTPNYSLRRAAEDWLREGLVGRSPKTVKKNENVLEPILLVIGGRRLRELTAGTCSTR